VRRFTLLLLITLLPLSVFALDITDPLGDIYDDIQVWYEAGLIDEVPSLRPYPAQVLVTVLGQVTADPDTPPADRAQAEEYLGALTAKQDIDGVWFGKAQLKSSESEEYLFGGAGIEYNTWFSEYIALNGRWVAFGKYEGDGYYPAGEGRELDSFDDNADMGIAGRKIDLRQLFTNSFSLGTDSLYFQAGIHRSSYGPVFDNGAVLGGYAHNAPTFNVVWDSGGKFGMTNTYIELSASNYYGEDVFPDKRMVMQTYTYRPFEWAEFEFLQSIVYGNRFDLVYFVPFSFLFYNQNLAGYEDNSWMGFSMALDLPRRTGFNGVLYIDDAHFNDFLRFDFNTMFKAAINTEFTWTPMHKYLRRLSLDYLAVTPYTYSHKSKRFSDDAELTTEWLAENANYLNYTTYGDTLGPVLDPNSDRITIKYHARPLPQLDVKLIGRMIRHGNSTAEGYNSGGTYTDGSVYDDGYDDDEDQTFQDLRFLTQDALEYTFTAGFDLGYTFDLDPHTVKLLFGYRLEHIRNKMNSGGYPVKGDNETSHYLMGGFAYSCSF
jgi:hypothetical protein